MLKIINIFFGLFRSQAQTQSTKTYERTRDEIVFQTKTVEAMQRLVTMCDTILSQNREYHSNSTKLTDTLKEIVSQMTKGFSEIQKGNNLIQRELLTQNSQVASIINKLIAKEESKHGC